MKLLLASFTVLIASAAFAQTATQTATEKREAVVNQRQENQEKRIEQGAASGQLTKREEQRLEKREKHIQNMEDRAMADGKMTKKEFNKIEHAQNRTSRAIYRQKHDRQHK